MAEIGDVWALMQAENARKPRPNAALQPLVGTHLENISDIPMDPSHPRWKEKIQPPADPGVQPVLAAPTPTGGTVPTTTADSRLTIYYSRQNGYYNIAIERKPDWEIDGGVYTVREDHVLEMLPILQKIIKIKDTTGDFNVYHAEEQSSPVERVSSPRPRTAKPRKKHTKTSGPVGDAEAGTDHAADSNGAVAVGWGFETGDPSFSGSGVQSDPEGEGTGVVAEEKKNPLSDPKYREELEQQLKVRAYKKQQRLRKDLGVDDEDTTRLVATGDRGG